MQLRRLVLAVLVATGFAAGTPPAIPVGAAGQRSHAGVSQRSPNADLIRAIARNDAAGAIAALRAGADPNTTTMLPATEHTPAYRQSALLLLLDFRWRSLVPFDLYADGYQPAKPPPENIPILAALLRAGARVNVTGEGGLTPLQVAAWQGHARSAELLLRYGARVDDVGRAPANQHFRPTPLILAVSAESTDTAAVLVRYGADPWYTDGDDWTALQIARNRHMTRAVAILTKAQRRHRRHRRGRRRLGGRHLRS